MSGMTVTVVGCSGSVPGPASACSCYLLRAEHEGRAWHLALDLGNGALGALQRYVDPLALDAVVLSHLHADHCIDLACLVVWRRHHPVHRPEGRLPVHAPVGAAERLARAYGVPGAEEVTDVYDVRDLAHEGTFRVGPFTLTSYRVAHPVEAYGFRVECDGAVLAYTGDTDSCPELLPLMKGADLVLADTAFVDGRDDDAPGIHLSGSRAARAAVDAGGVRRLVLTHVPPWNDPEVCRAQAAAVWPGVVELARPGDVYRLGP